MKTSFSISRLAMIAVVALSPLFLSAQLTKAEAPAKGFKSAPNWISAGKTCFGPDANLSWLNGMFSDNNAIWVNESNGTMIGSSSLTQEEYSEMMEELENGLMSGTGVSWFALETKDSLVTEGQVYEYSLQTGGKLFHASFLLIPSNEGGVYVSIFTPANAVSRTNMETLATCFAPSNGPKTPLAANCGK